MEGQSSRRPINRLFDGRPGRQTADKQGVWPPAGLAGHVFAVGVPGVESILRASIAAFL